MRGIRLRGGKRKSPLPASLCGSRRELDSESMPIYEYRCDGCGERYEELLSTFGEPAPPCPKCGSNDVKRLMSQISTEWLPSDVSWDRVGRTW